LHRGSDHRHGPAPGRPGAGQRVTESTSRVGAWTRSQSRRPRHSPLQSRPTGPELSQCRCYSSVTTIACLGSPLDDTVRWRPAGSRSRHRGARSVPSPLSALVVRAPLRRGPGLSRAGTMTSTVAHWAWGCQWAAAPGGHSRAAHSWPPWADPGVRRG
jgi:hypothetical protein